MKIVRNIFLSLTLLVSPSFVLADEIDNNEEGQTQKVSSNKKR